MEWWLGARALESDCWDWNPGSQLLTSCVTLGQVTYFHCASVSPSVKWG